MAIAPPAAAPSAKGAPAEAAAVRVPHACVYLDYNGTTPIHSLVLDAMLPYLTEHFGNPSSSHHYGREPKRAVEGARRSLLRLLRPREWDDSADESSPDPSSIVFTGCGTESNNLAIRLALLSSRVKADANGELHVVSTEVEHPAVTQCLNSYASGGFGGGGLTPRISVTYVPVDGEGAVSARDVFDAIRPNTALVTVMAANNEVGSVQPIFDIAEYCRRRGVLFHTDAAQAVGKIDLSGLAHPETGADMATIVGHKFGAPKGVAALYVRPRCLDEEGRSNPADANGGGKSVLLMGGGQEDGRRGGTENVPYIAGMGRAAEMLLDDRGTRDGSGWERNARRMAAMRERLLRGLVRGMGGENGVSGAGSGIVRANGPSDPARRLPNTLSVGIRGVRSGELLVQIGNIVACSAGSACHSSSCSGGSASYSAILKAMKVPPEYAIGTLRLSVGPDTSEGDIDFAVEVIVKEARRQLGCDRVRMGL